MPETEQLREEFHLPITLTVGEKQIEVPLVVTMTFPQLAEIVRDHLANGTDVYGALLEHYAESVGNGAKPTRSAPSIEPKRSRRRKPETA